MPIFAQLGESLSRLSVMIIQSNNVIGGACQKRLPPTKKQEFEGERGYLDPRFYPVVMHGPEKHCRFIISGNEPFVTASSAEKAAELLIKYINQLEPWPAWHKEEQLMLFPPATLPELKAA